MLFRDQLYFISIFCITNNTRSGKLIFLKNILFDNIYLFLSDQSIPEIPVSY